MEPEEYLLNKTFQHLKARYGKILKEKEEICLQAIEDYSKNRKIEKEPLYGEKIQLGFVEIGALKVLPGICHLNKYWKTLEYKDGVSVPEALYLWWAVANDTNPAISSSTKKRREAFMFSLILIQSEDNILQQSFKKTFMECFFITNAHHPDNFFILDLESNIIKIIQDTIQKEYESAAFWDDIYLAYSTGDLTKLPKSFKESVLIRVNESISKKYGEEIVVNCSDWIQNQIYTMVVSLPCPETLAGIWYEKDLPKLIKILDERCRGEEGGLPAPLIGTVLEYAQGTAFGLYQDSRTRLYRLALDTVKKEAVPPANRI